MSAVPLPEDISHPLLERTLSEWRRSLLARALVSGLTLALVVAAALVVLDQMVSLPVLVRQPLRALPLVVFLLGSARVLARVWARPAPTRLALLAEEHRPELGYRLATLVGLGSGNDIEARLREDHGEVTRAFVRAVGESLGRVKGPVVPLGIGRDARWLLGAAAASLALLFVVPGGLAEITNRWLELAPGPATGVDSPGSAPIGRTAAAARAVFRGVQIRVEPPGYTSQRSYELDPSGLQSVLVGSRVFVTGAPPDGSARVEARVLGGARAVNAFDGDSFAFDWTMSAEDRGLELVALREGTVVARNVIALDAKPDQPPVVDFLAPDRDLVLATARGSVSLRASARDDYGVQAFDLHWILTRGSDESFSSTEGTLPWTSVQPDGATRTGRYDLDVAALGMGPGDVLHVRAVAEDGNSVTGPGRGVSQTRVIRIAREDQQDQANTLIGFPIEPEGDPVLTQRMIVLLTERLVERTPDLAPDALRAEAEEVARAQARVRERFADVAFARTSGALAADSADPHDHDPDPTLAVNQRLVPALDAMFEAEGHLHLSEPGAALPAEYRALEIVQSVREAERVFVRGVQTVAPIDVDAARGTGSVSNVAPASRTPGRVLASAERYLPRLAEASALLRERPLPEVALTVSSLAAELLADPGIDSRVGALLARAATATQEGRVDEATLLIAEARARLAPPAGGQRATPAAAGSGAGAAFLRALAAGSSVGVAPRAREVSAAASARLSQPFTFATARYASGDWDSAPLVPSNLIHSLALYTDIPVVPDGVIVDLASSELFRYPFVYLTGHLPVQFTSAEARNLREYIERGGFLFVDDHNHDIDGAFHRTVTAELKRVFGEEALMPVPKEHELYHAFFVFEDGPPTTSHELNGWGDGLVHDQLFAVERGGRIAVLYSNKDYSSEWSYHAANKRFLGLDNTRFGVNVLLYALTR